jgi:uncharacterized protein (DUF2141 family)
MRCHRYFDVLFPAKIGYARLNVSMLAILLLFLVSFSLNAQTPKGNYSLSGVVTDTQTGEPVKNALVTLTEMPVFKTDGSRAVPPTPSAPKSKLAGIGGEFQFDGLAEGQYRLNAEKPGFQPDHTSNKPVKLLSSMTDVHLNLSPYGVIEGKVVDQYGDPIRRANVIAMQARIDDGSRVTSKDRSVTTDDLGMYRVWNLAPGKFYMKAAGKSGGTYTYVADNAPLYDASESFAPVYSGGAYDLDSATPVEIANGAHAQADITVTLEPAFKIRGALGNFIPYQTAKFELLRGAEDVSASRVSLNGATGRFEIQDVTPGTYTLRATQNQNTRAETTVTVNGRDVNDVALPLAPGVTVKVVQTTATQSVQRAPETGDQVEGLRGGRMSAACNVKLRQSGRSSAEAHTMMPAESGESTAERVLPGEYQVVLLCFGGYVTSATAGSADLLANPRLTIQPGVAPPPIEIATMPGGGTLKGKLVLDSPPAQAWILLVPAFSASTGPTLQPLFQMPDTQGGIEFQVPFLAPGDYTIYALSAQNEIEFRNPLVLQSLSGGTHVKIDPSGEQEITITSLVK